MELNERADIDTSQVEDRRGSGGGFGGGGFRGGGLPIPIPTGRGGIIGTIIVIALMLLGGGFFGSNMLGGDGGGTGDNTDIEKTCARDNPDRLKQVECRNALFINSIQNYWQSALPQTMGKPYEPAKTVFYSQAVSSGCGQADSGVGPFYCPADRQIYIDLTFWEQLATQLGARGEFAQPYVLAHEYGHHVQTLLGTEAQVRRAQQRDPANANALSVRMELQADCYSGAWAKNATRTTDAGGQPIFKSITQDDINQALEAAAAVGDDTIQKKSGGPVNEEEFTHGTSAQRQEWFNRGFASGDPKSCDTFGNAV
ncbi:MAG TPA: neutral zinc metallopeptidase [Micromonosporaceae bacterium]|nr:neutral zinc metallopeptidase [Micromonosporaceae bacterium]